MSGGVGGVGGKAQHTYSSGYGSDALLTDSLPVDLRSVGHYGDMHTAGTWDAGPPGVHAGYNRSNGTRGSQNSLRHIYESPDFLNVVRTGSVSRDAC